jgi:hypothetical protein
VVAGAGVLGTVVMTASAAFTPGFDLAPLLGVLVVGFVAAPEGYRA